MEQLKRIIIPSTGQTITCLLLALCTMAVVYRNVILQKVFGSAQQLIQESYLDQLANLNNIPIIRTGVIVLFWATVGLVAYAIYLAISNAIVDTRNEVVIDTAYANRGLKLNRFKGVFLQIGGGIALIIFLVLLGTVLISLLFGLFEKLLFEPFDLMTGLSGLGGVVGLAFSYYLVWTLGQITWDAPQLS
jgi:hypothetical protein